MSKIKNIYNDVLLFIDEYCIDIEYYLLKEVRDEIRDDCTIDGVLNYSEMFIKINELEKLPPEEFISCLDIFKIYEEENLIELYGENVKIEL